MPQPTTVNGPRKKEPLGETCAECGWWRRRTVRGQLFRCSSEQCRGKDLPACTALPGCGGKVDGRNGSICSGHAGQRRKGKPFTPLRKKRPDHAVAVRDGKGHKECADCLQWLPEDRFTAQKQFEDGLSIWCSECRKVRDLVRYYNMTVADYQKLLTEQRNSCAICHREPGARLHIDHDHQCCPEKKRSCGKCVRGLLCGPCNAGIGMLRESEELMLRAASYVRTRSVVTA